jgi:hypothetical protein
MSWTDGCTHDGATDGTAPRLAVDARARGAGWMSQGDGCSKRAARWRGRFAGASRRAARVFQEVGGWVHDVRGVSGGFFLFCFFCFFCQ